MSREPVKADELSQEESEREAERLQPEGGQEPSKSTSERSPD